MTELKITNIGDDACVVLPKDVLERLNLSAGDSLYAIETKEGIELRPSHKLQLDIAERVMQEDADILRRLAE